MSNTTSSGATTSSPRSRPQNRPAVVRAVRQIKKSPELFAKYQQIRDALSRCAAEEITNRLAIGRLVAEVRADHGTYGSGAVRLLAKVLGVRMSSLYETTSVASAFTPEQVEVFGTRKGSTGVVISYSHLVCLASVRPASRRTSLLERVYAEGLSVRDLRIVAAPRDPLAPLDAEKSVRRGVRLVSSLVRRGPELIDALKTLGSASSDESLREFREAYAVLSKFVAEAAPLVGEETPTPALFGGRRGGEA